MIRTLVAIARARDWADVTISGTERFRREAWYQGERAGLKVRGHKPTELDKAQLGRALNANPKSQSRDRTERSGTPQTTVREDSTNYGTLIAHGVVPYQHDSKQQPSYYVSIKTADGEDTYWGKDLQRAITDR